MSKIRPTSEDFERVEREFGRLPDDATQEQHAERYRLAQACALVRISLADGEGA